MTAKKIDVNILGSVDVGVLKRVKVDFNNAICLMSIIPSLAFVYVVAGKLASLDVLAGEVGYIMLVIISLILLGIITGKRILWSLTRKLVDLNEHIIRIEKELMEKNRLAAITEIVLSLSHEINNPLLVLQGNLTLLEDDINRNKTQAPLGDRVNQMKTHCERIVDVMNKMSRISKPVSVPIHGNTRMVDLASSELRKSD